jgi:hypothetical protein
VEPAETEPCERARRHRTHVRQVHHREHREVRHEFRVHFHLPRVSSSADRAIVKCGLSFKNSI